jgi:hypothetical protein
MVNLCSGYISQDSPAIYVLVKFFASKAAGPFGALLDALLQPDLYLQCRHFSDDKREFSRLRERRRRCRRLHLIPLKR